MDTSFVINILIANIKLMKIMYEVVDMTYKSLCTNHGQQYSPSPLFQN